MEPKDTVKSTFPVVMLETWKPSKLVAVVNASVLEPLTVNGRSVLTSGPM